MMVSFSLVLSFLSTLRTKQMCMGHLPHGKSVSEALQAWRGNTVPHDSVYLGLARDLCVVV